MVSQNSDNEIIEAALTIVPEYDGYNISVHDFFIECQEALDLVGNDSEFVFVKLIKSRKLKGEARKSVLNEQFDSFLDFKIYLLERFLTYETIEQLFGKISSLYQFENESVISFGNRIRNIGQQILDTALCEQKLNNNFKNYVEKTLVESFTFGLNQEINVVLKDKQFNNFQGVFFAAAKIEKYIANLRKIRNTTEKYLVSHCDFDFIVNPKILSSTMNKQFITNESKDHFHLDKSSDKSEVSHVPSDIDKAPEELSSEIKCNEIINVKTNVLAQDLVESCPVEITNIDKSFYMVENESIITVERQLLVKIEIDNVIRQMEENKSNKIVEKLTLQNKLKMETSMHSKDKLILNKDDNNSGKNYYKVFKIYEESLIYYLMMKLLQIYRIRNVIQNTLKHSSNLELNPTLNLMPT